MEGSQTAAEPASGRLNALELVRPDCVADDFGGEVVVLNMASGVYYSLRDLAAAVWRDLMAGQSLPCLAEALAVCDKRLAEKTVELVNELVHAGLLRRVHTAPLSAAAETIELVHGGETRLTFEAFEDMKDLILSDPIHEADAEIGWPTLRAQSGAS